MVPPILAGCPGRRIDIIIFIYLKLRIVSIGFLDTLIDTSQSISALR